MDLYLHSEHKIDANRFGIENNLKRQSKDGRGRLFLCIIVNEL